MCSLLSFAQGCRIKWVYYESFTSSQILLTRFHRSLIDTSPTGVQIIPADADDFDKYIQHCFPIYPQKENFWDLTALIDLFVRATATQPFLEQKGLHLASFVEYLCRTYSDITGVDTVIEEEKFNRKSKKLRKDIKESLIKNFPDIKEEQLNYMLEHISEFKRYSFRFFIKSIAEYLNLKLSDHEIDNFVKNRNSLVHKYHFTIHKENQAETEVFYLMVALASKFILAILEYPGNFYDWSTPIPPGSWQKRKRKLTFIKRSNS